MKPIVLKRYPLKIKEEPLFDESSDILQTKQQRKYYYKSLTKIPLDNDFNFSLAHTPTKNLTQACLQEVDQRSFGFLEKTNNKVHFSFLSKILKNSRKLSSLTTICFENEIEAIDLLKYSLRGLKNMKEMKVHFLLVPDQSIMQYWIHFMRKVFRQHRLTHLSLDIFIKPAIIPSVISLFKGLARMRTLEYLSINLFSTSPLSECSKISQVINEISSLITSLNALKSLTLNFPNLVDKYHQEIGCLWQTIRHKSDLRYLQANFNFGDSTLNQSIKQTLKSLSKLVAFEVTLEFYHGVSTALSNFFQALSPLLRSLEINLRTRSQYLPPNKEDWSSLVNGICSLENLESLKYQYQSDKASQDYLSLLADKIGCLKKLDKLEIGGEGELGSAKDRVEVFEILTRLIGQTRNLVKLGIEFHLFNSERKFRNDWLCLFLVGLSQLTKLKALKLVLGETPCTDQFLEYIKHMLKILKNVQALELDFGSRRFSNKGITELGRGFEEFLGTLDTLHVTIGGGKIRKGMKNLINSLVKKVRTRDVEIMVELCSENVEDSYEDIFELLNGSPYSKQWKLDIFDF